MTLGYARAIKGKRAYNKCPFNRGRNVTLIGASAISGLLAPFTFQGLKQYLRSVESRTYEELDRALTEAINLVTDNDIIGWFTHCCYYVPPN